MKKQIADTKKRANNIFAPCNIVVFIICSLRVSVPHLGFALRGIRNTQSCPPRPYQLGYVSAEALGSDARHHSH